MSAPAHRVNPLAAVLLHAFKKQKAAAKKEDTEAQKGERYIQVEKDKMDLKLKGMTKKERGKQRLKNAAAMDKVYRNCRGT